MRISFASVFVSDQDRALAFYTDVLGFVKKTEVPAGKFRFLTVVSPEDPDGVELLLEPDDNPAARAFQVAIREQGIPATTFAVADLRAEHERLVALGVEFTSPPTEAAWGASATLDDTCGNLIQLHQLPSS